MQVPACCVEGGERSRTVGRNKYFADFAEELCRKFAERHVRSDALEELRLSAIDVNITIDCSSPVYR
jgi:hypothetical protein